MVHVIMYRRTQSNIVRVCDKTIEGKMFSLFALMVHRQAQKAISIIINFATMW
jgi:hypothetical protein